MIIHSINNNKYNSNYNNNLRFKAYYLPEKFYRNAEKYSIKAERVQRRVMNTTTNTINWIKDKFKQIAASSSKKVTINAEPQTILPKDYIAAIKSDPQEHMLAIYQVSKDLANGKEVEINIENNELIDLANDNESCIFIMNHDKQKEDTKLLCFFNALLTREYLCNDKSENCPKPKIIINKDILDTLNENDKILGELLGFVGIDAGIHCADKKANTKIFTKLIKDFIENKNNIFIFPEGKMCAFSGLDYKWKFQSGIADFIKVALNKKPQVKVVPLGFAYNRNVGAINIGKPLYFKKTEDGISFKPQELYKFQDEEYINFIRNSRNENGWFKITDSNKTVDKKNIGDYIAGILCENLHLSKIKAYFSIKNVGTTKDSDTIYTIED